MKAEYSHEDAYRSFYRQDDSGSLLEPVVSRHLHEKGFRLNLPENRPFAVCLTHDIDDIYPPFLHRAASSIYHLKNLDTDGLRREIFWRKDGRGSYSYRNFRDIMRLEERYDARSSFYFLATDRDIQRSRVYEVETLESEIGEISDRGWEVGLHGGYYSYNNADAIKREKARLEKVAGRSVRGYRNHWLCFRVPDTWEYLKAAGFSYDTTIGYNDYPGYRNGMCYPYKPFSLRDGKEIDIVEIPLAIMDCSLFESSRSLSSAWETVTRIVDAAEKYNGIVTLLWHNNVFGAAFWKEWKKMYEKILDYCYRKNAYITSGEEILKLGAYHDDQADR